MASNGKAAQEYARRFGWAVFPCHSIVEGRCTCGKADCGSPGKHPRTAHGVKDASSDLKQIAAWWAEWPDANIAIACGAVSGGLVVLDVDTGHAGDESLDDLVTEYGPLPETPEVLTGGGGRHLYFRSEQRIPNLVGQLGRGLDLRGDGGYVIAPKSGHISGREYLWEESSRPTDLKLAELPAFVAALAVRGQGNAPRIDRVDPDGILGGIPAGKRHAELYAYACRLRTLNLKHSEAVILVSEAAARCKPAYTDEPPEKLVDEAWKHTEGKVGDFAAKLAAEASGGPVIVTENRAVRIDWLDRGVRATAKALKEHSDGKITGHLLIEAMLPGLQKALRSAQFTFTALQTRKQWANDLSAKLPPLPWDSMFEVLCAEVTRYVQEGEKITEIDIAHDPEPEPNGFLLFPVIAKGHPTVLFGSPGTGKSYLAEWWAHLLLAGESQGDLELRVDHQASSVLYLDWEGDEMAFRQRARAIQRGGSPQVTGLHYRRCTRPLAADLDQIQAQASEIGPDLIIVDSLAPATGGDLNTSGPPNDFFGALRALGSTALVLAHVAKGAAGGANASIFGSVFFTALARSVWQVRSDTEDGADQVSVALFHSKVNYGRRERPFGLTIYHGEDGATTFRPGRIDDVTSAATARSLKDRIMGTLAQMGTATAPEITEALGDVSQGTVRTTLSRMLADELVARIGIGRGQKWSRVARETPEWQQ
uniref:Putative bifunctional DNA primase/polymerase n=1 Tax=viral metagenome TaxID=1070528 RepID=A0A6H1Z7L8_9ZZZZ